jgi:hypothetical protein
VPPRNRASNSSAARRRYTTYLLHEPKPDEPSHAAAHWRLGQIAELRGDVTTARQAYVTASAMDPKFKQAKEALARVK